jgi:hypothetical protein
MSPVRVNCLTLVTLAVAGIAAPSALAGPADSLGWLTGCWERQTRTMRTVELWMEPRGGTLLGLSRTTRGDTLVEFEFIRIYEDGDTLVFAAAPSGQPAAEFRALRPHSPELVFENPAHDFPQRIRYRPSGSDSLIASIEGSRGGQPRRVVFAYRRIDCPAGRVPQSDP